MPLSEKALAHLRQFDDDNLHPDIQWLSTEVKPWAMRVFQHLGETELVYEAIGHLEAAKSIVVTLAEEKDRVERRAARSEQVYDEGIIIDIEPANENERAGE